MRQDTDNLYKKRGFTPNGDYELHLDEDYKPWGIFVRYEQKEVNYDSGIEILNKLSVLPERGIPVFYVFPSYPEEEFERFKKALFSFETQMRKGLMFPVLGRVSDFLSPESDFYDTVYHLCRNGRAARTEKLIKTLRKELRLVKPKA
jgi:hypothetical protein